MKAYFKTPIGYVFIAIFLAVSGFLFAYTCLYDHTTDTSRYFTDLMFAYILIIPLLTMKSFAEEKRMGTEQLLLTSPVSLIKLVAAKFLSCFTMFFITLCFTSQYFIILGKYGEPNAGKIFGSLIGMAFIGICFIAIGIFISSLTQNQFVAAMVTIGVLLFLLAVGLLESLTPSVFLKTVVNWISIYSRFNNFLIGRFDIAAALYYLSAAFIFLFLTVRVYEKRRYA